MSEQGQSKQGQSGQSGQGQAGQTDPAQVIAQVLTETRDSEQDENQIAQRILSALRDAGCDLSGQSTSSAD